MAATGLDRAAKRVLLDNGEQVPYDLLLIATGIRARPWSNPAEAALDGVFTIRTRDDAAAVAGAVGGRAPAGPGHRRRVHRLGGCLRLPRARLAVTLAERGEAPLVGALGGVIGQIAADMQREARRGPPHAASR